MDFHLTESPRLLRKIHCLILVSQYAKRPRVNLVPMAVHQFLVGLHVALLRGEHQLLVNRVGDI